MLSGRNSLAGIAVSLLAHLIMLLQNRRQQAPQTYHGCGPPMAPAATPYQAKQAQQQYLMHHTPLQQYPAHKPQPYHRSQLHPAQPPQPLLYQDQHQPAGQQAHACPSGPQQQPKRGSGIAGKLTGMFKSKLTTPSQA